MMTLCSHDSYAIFDPKTNETKNFMVSVKPRVLCLSDAFPTRREQDEVSNDDYFYKLLDYCFI